MIKRRSGLFTLLLLLLLLFSLARLFIHSPPSFSWIPPFFFLSSSSSSWTPICDLPDHAIIPSQTTCTCTYTIRHKKGFRASTLHTYCTVPYMYLTCTLHARTYIIQHKKGFPALVVVVGRT